MDNKYNDKGLHILAFPCNQFKESEPGLPFEINNFIRNKYHAKFFVSEKIDVNGANTNPVYNYLRTNSSLHHENPTGLIPYNFSKFLVDGEGQVKSYYPPATDPLTIVPDIEHLLKKWVNNFKRENL